MFFLDTCISVNKKRIPELIQGFFAVSFFFTLLLIPQQSEAGTISRPVHNNGLVGYWSFDVGKGGTTVYDLSGQGNHGTLTSMDPSSDWVDGQIGSGALEFDGNDDLVSLPESSSLQTAVQNYTVAAWVRMPDSSGIQFNPVVGLWGSTGDASWRLGYEVASGYDPIHIYHQIHDGSSNTAYEGSINLAPSGSWHFLVATQSGLDLRLYVDGVLDTNFTAVVPDNDPSGNRIFGNAGNHAADEIRIYNRALSAEEIARLYRVSAPRYNASSVGKVTDQLKGHWTFDGNDMVPRVLDRSGAAHDGRLSGGATTTTIGALGQALHFNGASQCIESTTHSDFDMASRDASISLWFKRTLPAAATMYLIESESGGGDNGWDVFFLSSGANLRIRHAGTSPISINQGSLYATTDTTWHHVAIVKASTTVSLYFDGVFKTSSTGSGLLDGNNHLYIGCANGNTGWFKGAIDDVRLYHKALSRDEIKRLYELGAPSKMSVTPTRITNGLVGHWTFDGNDTVWSANRTLDKSGQGNHGTLTNMSTSTSPVFGRLGQALSLDGVNAYIALTADGFVISGAYTYTGWFQADGEGTMFSDNWCAQGGGGLAVDYETASGVRVYRFTSNDPVGCSTAAVISSGALSSGWHHYAVVYDNQNVILYIDGVRDTSGSASFEGFIAQDGSQAIARRQHGSDSNYFPGILDDIRVYNRALPAEEIQQLYNMGR